MAIKNVIFLGAGASKADGAPLQGDLFSVFFAEQFSHSSETELKIKIQNFFQEYFGIQPDNTNPTYPTFEEVLGILEFALSREEQFKGNLSIADLVDIRKSLIMMIAVILDRKLRGSAHYHRKLVNKLKDNNTLQETCFVSLNYDILIDNAIAEVHPDFDLDYGIDFTNYSRDDDWHKPSSKIAVKLFKLHGSLNWLYCPICNSLTLTPKKKGVCKLLYNPDECSCLHCNSSTVPIIIPPTYFKVMSNYYLREVWHKTEEVLRTAEKLIFCGYSFPDADIHVKYLLKRVELHRDRNFEIVVANNHETKTPFEKEEEEKRFRRFLKDADSINYSECSFEEYCDDPFQE